MTKFCTELVLVVILPHIFKVLEGCTAIFSDDIFLILLARRERERFAQFKGHYLIHKGAAIVDSHLSTVLRGKIFPVIALIEVPVSTNTLQPVNFFACELSFKKGKRGVREVFGVTLSLKSEHYFLPPFLVPQDFLPPQDFLSLIHI